MTTIIPNQSVPGASGRRLFNRSTVLAFIAGAAVAVGIGVTARGGRDGRLAPRHDDAGRPQCRRCDRSCQ